MKKFLLRGIEVNNNMFETNEDLCRKCFIKLMRPSKKEIKHIILTDYTTTCEHCGRKGPIVDYVGDEDY